MDEGKEEKGEVKGEEVDEVKGGGREGGGERRGGG